MALNSCSIGRIKQSECHKPVFTNGKVGIFPIIELSKESFELLVWRTGIRKNSLKTICLHHQKQYLDKFTLLNPNCCDPFEHHIEKKNYKGMLIYLIYKQTMHIH